MAAFVFRLPDIGEGVAEAEIVAWHVAVGDVIAEDQSLVDVMTDKATVDMTSPVAGRVTKISGEIGAMVPVGSMLVELDVEGDAPVDDAPPPPRAEPALAPSPAEALPPIAQAPLAPPPVARPVPSPPVSPAKSAPPLAAPATRRRAHELGIALDAISATGPGGRITPADLDAYIARGAGSAGGLAKRTGVTPVKIVGLRRRIAERMERSKRRIPHFSYVEEFDMTELEALRRDVNAGASEKHPKLTMLPFFMRAIAQLVPDFPNVNARYDDEAGVLAVHDGVHIGIATQTANGLIVPVVAHVEALDIWGCARELGRVTKAARDGSASRETLSGSTITLTSLGVLGGISATPVINAPEVAIIGPNKLVDRPVVRDGAITVRTLMNLSSSFDHRIVDGYDAARFIQAMKRLIERPALLFMGKP